MFKFKMICKLTMPIWISDWLKMSLRVYIGLSLISYIMCIIQYTQLHVYFIQSIFFCFKPIYRYYCATLINSLHAIGGRDHASNLRLHPADR